MSASAALLPASPFVRPALTADQRRFLRFHMRPIAVDPPCMWRWEGLTLRAYTETGMTMTLSASEFESLVSSGLMERMGCAGARITDAGRRACQ